MRLIDADKLFPDCMTKDGKLAISQSQLANAPTVDTYTIEDIQEVRENALILGAKLAQRPQGEWVKDEEHSITIEMFKCTICGFWNGAEHFRFCPNCGAKMQKDGTV